MADLGMILRQYPLLNGLYERHVIDEGRGRQSMNRLRPTGRPLEAILTEMGVPLPEPPAPPAPPDAAAR